MPATSKRSPVRALLLYAACASSLCMGTAYADATLAEWHAVSASDLDEVRGGFKDDSGISIALNIQRVAWVNGQMVAKSVLDVPSLGQVTELPSGLAIGPMLLQNQLSNQKIQASTLIDVTVNGGMRALRALNAEWALREAILNSLHR